MRGVGIALLLAAGAAAGQERRSGFEFMQPPTQAMQEDDTANPGMLSVLEGGARWSDPAGAAARSCADCHGAAEDSMAGVAARYPAWDEATGEAVDLAGRINLCRVRHQEAEPLERETAPLLSLEAFVAHQSRGDPIAPDPDPRLDRVRAEGRRLFEQPVGQLDLACADCHDDHWGRHLASSPIPQGHPTGYPIYRLEWQELGSLQRRFRNCMVGVRAEPYRYGSAAFIALELFLKDRAAGMPIETPAVRP